MLINQTKQNQSESRKEKEDIYHYFLYLNSNQNITTIMNIHSLNPSIQTKINIKYQFPATTDYKDNNLEILKLKFCYARTDWDCPILGLSYKTSNP